MLRARGRVSARSLGIVLGAHYEQGALIPDETAPLHAADSVADYSPCAGPGHRAPHVWLDDVSTASTLGLFGEEFVLLTPASDRWEAATDRTVIRRFAAD